MTKPEIRPQEGPQRAFFLTSADLAIYGGAAGSGKSYALLMEPLRHVTTNSQFSAVFFRRTTTQITNPGGLWDESQQLYPMVGGKPKIGPHEWHWKSGGKVKFAHLEHEDTKLDWQGSQVPLLCCQEDEKVRMADGSLKAVRDIVPGDMVQTLQGARRVLWTGGRRQEECVRAVVRGERGELVGEQTHSATHRVLTAAGWVSYADWVGVSGTYKSGGPRPSSTFGSKVCRCVRKFAGRFGRRFRFPGRRLGNSSCRSEQSQAHGQSPLDRQSALVTDAYEAQLDRGTDCGLSGCEPQAPQKLSSGSLSGVVLHAHSLREEGPASACRASAVGEDAYAQSESSLPGSLGYCSPSLRLCDERAPREPDTGLAGALRSNGAAARTRKGLPSDGRGKAQTRTCRKIQYAHPYRGEAQTAVEDTTLGSLELSPCGKRWVIDLTIEKDSHYITQFGVVNQNCFDELPHFSASQFWYLVSRNRSMSGVRGYVRATCNPDADSWVAEFISWWIDQDSGLPIPERGGVLRWMLRINDAIDWAESRDELVGRWKGKIPDDVLQPKSVTFIPAKLSDNKKLIDADPSYMANLLALPTVERERLLYGNWRIRPSAGLYFRRKWLKEVNSAPGGLRWVRAWDLAGTPKTETNNPDFTESVLIGRSDEGKFYIADHTWMRGTPAEVESEVKGTAIQDGRGVLVSLPQDPGQAGVAQKAAYAKLLVGYNVRVTPESRTTRTAAATPSAKSAKIARFGPFSAQCEAGNVYYVKGAWNNEFFDRLEAFPQAIHDDTADVCSRAFEKLTAGPEKARRINVRRRY